MQGYNEMLKRVEPKAIICYCDPFPEMTGNIITVDYAQTNNLSQKKIFYGYVKSRRDKLEAAYPTVTPQEINSLYVIKTGGYVITNGLGLGISGGGGGRGGGNSGSAKLNVGQQDKHIQGTNNYKQQISNGKHPSILTEDPKQLLDDFAGTGEKLLNSNKERVNFGKVIGQYYDESTGKYVDTTNGLIHYDSKGGAHIVPAKP